VFQVFLDAFLDICKSMFQVFQLFQMYVSIVLYGCCKSRLVCCHVAMVITYVASVYLHCFICFLYTYVASVSNAWCFICLLLYVISVVSRCCKSRSGCCTCCNGVSTVCSKCFICFIRMLQRFHLNIVKVDRSIAWCGRWLSLPLGRSSGSTDVGFPGRGRGSLRRTRARVLRWDEGHGARCGCGSSAGVEAVSGCDVPCGCPDARRSVSNIVALKLFIKIFSGTDHNRSCADFI
jgi:hypothetical protein